MKLRFTFIISALLHSFLIFTHGKNDLTILSQFKRGQVLIEVQTTEPESLSIKTDSGQKTKTVPKAPSTETKGILTGSDLGIHSPEYPALSRLRGEEGSVLLSIQLTESNRWVNIEVIESSKYPNLDRAAVSAVKSSLNEEKDGAEYKVKKVVFIFKLNQ